MFVPTATSLKLIIEKANYTIEKTTSITTFAAGKVYPIDITFTLADALVSVSPDDGATLDAWNTTGETESIEVEESEATSTTPATPE
jgi:hypothetical protein